MAATIPDALRAIERRIGVPISRGGTVARRLQDADLLPCGRPGELLPIHSNHLTSLLLAVLSGAILKQVAGAVSTYGNLVPAGLADLPAVAIDRLPAPTPRHFLNGILRLAVNGDADDRKWIADHRIEVVENWPEFAIDDGEKIVRFRAPGAISTHWAAPVRRATTISGGVLIDVARDLGIRE